MAFSFFRINADWGLMIKLFNALIMPRIEPLHLCFF